MRSLYFRGDLIINQYNFLIVLSGVILKWKRENKFRIQKV